MRFITILTIIFFSCSNNPESVKEFITKEHLPIEKIEGATMLHTENGLLKVKITASTIKRFQEIQPEVVFSNGVEVIFYNDSGLVNSVLKAENAEINESNKLMTASNNVILTSSDGKELQTEELIWDEKKNKIHTEKKVVITTEKEVIHGEGFKSNADFSEYSISKIYGTFNFNTTTE
tara:strand:- start:880 stop:1413 length:534 start_codon:yes stop_codon:yes gene_type:complete